MSWSVKILSSRPWLLRSQVPRLRDKSLFIYLAVKYSVVTRYNQTSRHIKFHSTKLEFHGQIATKFLLHCPRELANDVCVSLLFVFIHKILRQFKTLIIDLHRISVMENFINNVRDVGWALRHTLLPPTVDSSGDHTCSRKYYCSQHLTVGDRGATF